MSQRPRLKHPSSAGLNFLSLIFHPRLLPHRQHQKAQVKMQEVRFFKILKSGRVQVFVDGAVRSLDPNSYFWKRRFRGGLTAHLSDAEASRYQAELRSRSNDDCYSESADKPNEWPADLPRENYYEMDVLERAALVKRMNGDTVRRWRNVSHKMKEAGSAVT